MADKPLSSPTPSSNPVAPTGDARSASTDSASGGGGASRGLGQRTSEARDAMAEMAERAQAISQETGTKIAAAMKDVIGTAAGIAGFAVESARDLVQYMVRRGQMTQDEADKLIKEAEEAQGKRGSRSGAVKAAPERPPAKPDRSREVAPRAEAKPTPSAAKPTPSAVKRTSGPTTAPKTEKKEQGKRAPSAAKKSAKPSAPKKRR